MEDEDGPAAEISLPSSLLPCFSSAIQIHKAHNSYYYHTHNLHYYNGEKPCLASAYMYSLVIHSHFFFFFPLTLEKAATGSFFTPTVFLSFFLSFFPCAKFSRLKGRTRKSRLSKKRHESGLSPSLFLFGRGLTLCRYKVHTKTQRTL